MEDLNYKNFSKSKVSLPLPNLVSIQKDSWDWFWKESFQELLEETFPIRDYTEKKLEFSIIDFKLGEPKYADWLEAKNNNDSYEVPLIVKAQLKNLQTGEIKEQEIFLTDFPLMTERGSFIVNGVERVIVSQLIRSPGPILVSHRLRGKECFGAQIVPNRGAWLEFLSDTSGFIGVKINRKRKVAATTLLRALGFEKEEEIKKLFEDIDRGEPNHIETTLAKDPTKTQAEAFVEIYSHLRPGDKATPDAAKDFIENMIFDFKRYDLGKVGRWKMRQRLGDIGVKSQKLKIKKEDRVLKPEDVVAVIREIIRLNNTPGARPDPIDHLGNRRVRTLGELLQNRLRVGLMRMERIIRDRMSTLDIATMTPAQLVNPRPFMAVAKRFFASFQLSQFMDEENPLAELEHKRRLAATGPGGLKKKRASFEVRDVRPSHYGRVCPIQTPEGKNIGLVGHLSCFGKINPLGFIETPYFKVKKGKVTSEIEYFSAFEEEKYNIAHAGIKIDEKGKILEKRVEARLKGKPGIISREEIDFIDVSPDQLISVATACIPFLQNTDAARALMGSNMQRQAVPLLDPEPPFVMTGMEKEVAKNSGLQIRAKEDGRVREVDADHIKVQSTKKKGSSGIRNYSLNTFLRTNQYTCFHQKPKVKKGQKVKKGEILAEGGALAKGNLALGRNLLVAFLPWRGGNFEDAVLISEELVKEDVFTSINIESFFCDVRETKLGPEVTTSDIPNVSEQDLQDLDEEGVVRIGAQVGANDILVGKISPKGEVELTAEERLLKAIFGEKAKEVKDSSLRMEHGKEGRVIGVKVFSRDTGQPLEPGVRKRIEVEVAQLRKVQAGDKLSGRHGNKGVVSKVLPEEDMPFLEDGTPVDIILNPLTVASRMNLGQILETHLGWAAQKQGYFAVTPALAGATEVDIKEELKKAGLPEDGKIKLYDGRTGFPFPQKVTVGYIYTMKLGHMVKDKIHMRAIGPYSLITQQPLGGRARFGGQRFGEMEVWALEGYGAAHTLQEMLTIKSDDVSGRAAAYKAILEGEEIKKPTVPASFRLLVNELRALGLEMKTKKKEEK